MSMLTMGWFISVLIAIVLEGSSASAHGARSPITVMNQLNVLQAIQIGGWLGIPGAAVDFIKGLGRILLWDYQFYDGYFIYVRYFWMMVFSAPTIWGVVQAFSYVAAQFVRPF